MAATSLVDIPLPEDDAAAMAVICNVLHLRHKAVPARLAAEELLWTAMTVDKYACAESIKYTARDWIQKQRVDATDESLEKLLVAAFYLQDWPLCESLANGIVMSSARVIGDTFAGDHPQALERILCE